MKLFILKTGEEHVFTVLPGLCFLLITCELCSPPVGQDRPSPPLKEAGGSFPGAHWSHVDKKQEEVGWTALSRSEQLCSFLSTYNT